MTHKNRFGLSLLFLVLSNVPLTSYGLLSYTMEPIVGYERTQKLVPTQHTKDNLVYGVRATLGVLFIAAELEYLHGVDTESFPSNGLSTRDTFDKAKLGARASLRLLGLLRATARAGCQAKRNKHEESRNGVNVVVTEPVKYHPYAGGGLSARLGRNFEFTGDFTAVFTDFPDMNKNEYQATAGFVVRFP